MQRAPEWQRVSFHAIYKDGEGEWLMEEKPYTILGSTCYRRYSYPAIQLVFVAISIPPSKIKTPALYPALSGQFITEFDLACGFVRVIREDVTYCLE